MNSHLYLIGVVFLSLSLIAFDNEKRNSMNKSINEANLDFKCVFESDHLPTLDPTADVWFHQARALQKAPGSKNFDLIANLYRQAIEKDHYNAMINLQNILTKGLAKPVIGKSSSEEAIEITERMMKLNIPSGYYLMGHYLEKGYGVKRDKTAALAYFRKAADLGNPEAQNYLGQLFLTEQFEDFTEPKTLRVHFKKNPAYNLEIGKGMLDCAANQGNGAAADWLAGWFVLLYNDYRNALKYFQLGVKNGYRLSALRLSISFNGPNPTERGDYLALDKDPERVSRYSKIKEEIRHNPSARFPDIDKIVPLPPEKLPDWDGTFEYKKVSQEGKN